MRLQSHVDRISHEGVVGWAIDWEDIATPVDLLLVIDGAEVAHIRADQLRSGLDKALGKGVSGCHEFNYRFPKPLDTFTTHFVEIWTAKPQELLNGGRKMLPANPTGVARYVPIILTSSGRSGTTMLMEEFAGHPEIVISNGYPFEIKLSSYYAAAWNVLSAPTFVPSAAEVGFGDSATRNQIIGRNPWNRPDLLTAAGGIRVARLVQSTLPERLLGLFRHTIEEYYTTIADETSDGQAIPFFAEKGVLETPVRNTIRTMFGTVREIVLVRDPRDFLCSAQKFWKYDIHRAIDGMRSDFPGLQRIMDEGLSDTLFIRYEDLILDPDTTRKMMYSFIGCASPPTGSVRRGSLVPDSHRTSRSAVGSIGRYKTDLSPEAIDLCQQTFEKFMKAFGYQ